MSNLDSPQIQINFTEDWQDYELIDSGDGRKLERYGKYFLIRPEIEAIWKPTKPNSVWKKANAVFHPAPEENGGHWEKMTQMPEGWEIEYQGLKCWLQLSRSRHIGIFPEQASQWNWIQKNLQKINKPIKVLNLFGYTGLASLSAARNGAHVTHVDASKKALAWARQNQDLSDLKEKPIRWILDDAFKFVQRESRRNSYYDAIILDPPKFGRGPKGEVWEFYRLMPNLLSSCKAILTKDPHFLMFTAYAVKASSITLYTALNEMMGDYHGRTIAGELALRETSSGRVLSAAVFGLWHNAKL